MASELNIALIDKRLSGVIGSNVAKTVRLMCVKCEGTLVTDGEASQVVGHPTQGQKRNVDVVNVMVLFRNGVAEMLAVLNPGEEAERKIREALQDVDRQVRAAIEPLMESVSDAIEAIVLTIHKEDFSKDREDDGDAGSGENCSLYMKELQGFLSRVSADFLAPFNCRDTLQVRYSFL